MVEFSVNARVPSAARRRVAPSTALHTVAAAAKHLQLRGMEATRLPSVRTRSLVGESVGSGRVVKPIECIAVGDSVWAWDAQSCEVVRRPVKRLFRHSKKELVSVRIIDSNGGADEIRATTEHPFWVVGKGWTAAGSLAKHDELQRGVAGGHCVVLAVSKINGRADVFNFEVSEIHNYFVGHFGVLVHNSSGEQRNSAERQAVETELTSKLLAHLLRDGKYDLEHLQRALGIDLLRVLPPSPQNNNALAIAIGRKQSGKSRLDRPAINRLSFNQKMARVKFADLDFETQARAVLAAHKPLSPSPLRPSDSAPSTFKAFHEEYSVSVDQGVLELAPFDDRPISDLDTIIPSIERVVSLFSEDSGVVFEDVAALSQLNMSRSDVPSLVVPIIGMSAEMAIRFVDSDPDMVLGSGTRAYKDTDGFRGLARRPQPGVLNHVEIRHIPIVGARAFINETIGWVREPDTVYSTLASSVRTKSHRVVRIFESVKQSVLMRDFDRLLKSPDSRQHILPAVEDLAQQNPAVGRRLLGERYGRAYSIPSAPPASGSRLTSNTGATNPAGVPLPQGAINASSLAARTANGTLEAPLSSGMGAAVVLSGPNVQMDHSHEPLVEGDGLVWPGFREMDPIRAPTIRGPSDPIAQAWSPFARFYVFNSGNHRSPLDSELDAAFDAAFGERHLSRYFEPLELAREVRTPGRESKYYVDGKPDLGTALRAVVHHASFERGSLTRVNAGVGGTANEFGKTFLDNPEMEDQSIYQSLNAQYGPPEMGDGAEASYRTSGRSTGVSSRNGNGFANFYDLSNLAHRRAFDGLKDADDVVTVDLFDNSAFAHPEGLYKFATAHRQPSGVRWDDELGFVPVKW